MANKSESLSRAGIPQSYEQNPETYEAARIREFQAELESLLDKGTLMGLLENLSTICYEKAEHVGVNWQEPKLQRAWERAGEKIGKLAASWAISMVLPS